MRVRSNGFADLNGDGQLDLLIGGRVSGSQILTAYLHQGSAKFHVGSRVGGSSFTGSFSTASYIGIRFAVGDINGDGKVDLVLDGGEFLLGNGAGEFTQVTTSPTSATRSGLTTFALLADLDLDGDLDVLFGRQGPDELFMFQHCPTGARATASSLGCFECPTFSVRSATSDVCISCQENYAAVGGVCAACPA